MTEERVKEIVREVLAEKKVDEPAKTDDGWIPWNGGNCPVDMTAKVKVRLRSGTLTGPTSAYDLYWKHINNLEDIVSYCVIEPTTPECERSGCYDSSEVMDIVTHVWENTANNLSAANFCKVAADKMQDMREEL